MGNPLVSEQFIRLLDDRLKEVARDTFTELDEMIDRFYRVETSEHAWEEFYGVGSTPDIVPFDGKIQYLPVFPGYYTRIEPKEFAGGIQIERKLIDDDRYNVIQSRQAGLIDSYARVKEKYGAQGFGYAFSSAFTFMQSEEGVALCSSSHTTKSGASTSSGFSNAGSTALSKTAIAATRIIMRQFRNDIGARITVNPTWLVVPDTLYDTACECVGQTDSGARSTLDPDSGNNKVNSQYGRWTVVSYPRLDDYDTNNWFMVDAVKMKEFLRWFDRIKPDIETDRDFDTKMIKQSIYGRYGYGWTDWRWVYGHNVG